MLQEHGALENTDQRRAESSTGCQTLWVEDVFSRALGRAAERGPDAAGSWGCQWAASF